MRAARLAFVLLSASCASRSPPAAPIAVAVAPASAPAPASTPAPADVRPRLTFLESMEAYRYATKLEIPDPILPDTHLAGVIHDVFDTCSEERADPEESFAVTVKAGVLDGRAVGVTLEMKPWDQALAACIERGVWDAEWQRSGRLNAAIGQGKLPWHRAGRPWK